MRTHGATRLLALTLSLRYVARFRTSLNSCDRSQRQNCSNLSRRRVAAICRIVCLGLYVGVWSAPTVPTVAVQVIISIGCSLQNLEKKKSNWQLKIKTKIIERKNHMSLSLILVFIPHWFEYCYKCHSRLLNVFIHLVVWIRLISVQFNECNYVIEAGMLHVQNANWVFGASVELKSILVQSFPFRLLEARPILSSNYSNCHIWAGKVRKALCISMPAGGIYINHW